MCRWMAYTGAPIHIEDLLFRSQHNLIDQSLSSRSAETPTNGDGFGLGWYGELPQPGLFRSIRPAWNDFNLRDLAAQVRSHLFFAHVRATSLATVQETNCHPFRYGKWLFVHNGEIHGVEKIHQALLAAIPPQYFANILGSTDSELMFHVALGLGLEADPLGGIARMVGLVERLARAQGVDEAVWMTVAVTDGRTIHAVRYASDGKAPTLYLSPDVEHLAWINPEAAQRVGPGGRAVVSEPIGKFPTLWQAVPENSAIVVGEDGAVEVRPFAPAA